MMRTADDLEGYLVRLERPHDRTDDDTFVVGVAGGQSPVALRLAPPVLVAQTAIGTVPEGLGADAEARLYRRLLELNATELLHAAYALEDDHIVLTAALELDNLDLNELEAVLADIGLALSKHVEELRGLAAVPAS